MNFVNLTCERCGSSMTIDADNRVCKCPYCGAQYLAEESDGIKKYKIQQENARKLDLDRLKYESRENKRERRHKIISNMTSSWVFQLGAFFVVIMLFIMCGFIPLFVMTASQTETPVSSKEIIGTHYEEVVNRFKDANFKKRYMSLQATYIHRCVVFAIKSKRDHSIVRYPPG